MAAITPRRSPLSPHIPRSPDSCSSASCTSSAERPPCRWTHRTRPGSTLPDRVAITSPSIGVNPIVVSTEWPQDTAASEAPAPRWAVTRRSSSRGRPRSSGGPRAGPIVTEPVEAEPADAPPVPPGPGNGVGRGLGRHAGMEGRVEAGDLGEVRSQGPQGVHGGQTEGIVQGGQIGEGIQGLVGPIVDEDGTREQTAAVDHAVTDRADLGVLEDEPTQCAAELRGLLTGKVPRCDQAVRIVQQPQLQAAGAGVDHEHVHPPTLPDGAAAPLPQPSTPPDHLRSA